MGQTLLGLWHERVISFYGAFSTAESGRCAAVAKVTQTRHSYRVCVLTRIWCAIFTGSRSLFAVACMVVAITSQNSNAAVNGRLVR